MFPFYKQLDSKDCGPTCLKIISKHYGKSISLNILRNLSETTREGSSFKGLSDAAEEIGFRTLSGQLTFKELLEEVPLPCIAHWNQNHFIVIYKVKADKVFVSDPAHGLMTYKRDEFIKFWIGEGATVNSEGLVLLLEPTTDFKDVELSQRETKGNLWFLFKYLVIYKKFLTQLLIGVFAGSCIQLLFPLLTQSLIDVGIQNQDINFVYLILFAQLFLFLGRTTIDILRGWILIHLSSRISISLLSDFFIKLMRLPMSFFDTRVTGDLIQRIRDHNKIEAFLTSTSLNTIFSIFNVLVFSLVLLFYNLHIFLFFVLGTLFYVLWIFFFLKRRETLEYKLFMQLSEEQEKVYEIVSGMQEIKMSNSETYQRWSWEHIQARVFRINLKGLAIDQIQSVGGGVINELKNILIIFFTVSLAIKGEITLGMVLAISFIIGQLNYPILDLIRFIQGAQDAQIALKRLTEIHTDEQANVDRANFNKVLEGDIRLDKLSFRYPRAIEPVIKDFTLTILENKTTAIVGASGSGKTTLLKLILKFYNFSDGDIFIGNDNLKSIDEKIWMERCGVVMQEGFIFNDSIANNIAPGVENIDVKKLTMAVEIACIKEFIEKLPQSYNTRIGSGGLSLSSGEKQRILIARAVYKDPAFIFFDEATSALDAKNERSIVNNLEKFFKNRTAVIIAHRLSTVRNADQIVVIDSGIVAETGDHDSLIKKRGIYYNLVKNQLEVENLG